MTGLDVSAHGLVHIYRLEGNDVVALSGVDLDIASGEVVGLLVENLAGVLVAAVAAIGAAAVAAVVVLPVLPMADEDSLVLTPDTSPHLVAFGWTVVGVCVWLAVLAVGVAVRQLHSSGADRIRDGGR